MRASIHTNGTEIPVISKGGGNDYIALIESIRNYSPDLLGVEFDSFKHVAGLTTCVLSNHN